MKISILRGMILVAMLLLLGMPAQGLGQGGGDLPPATYQEGGVGSRTNDKGNTEIYRADTHGTIRDVTETDSQGRQVGETHYDENGHKEYDTTTTYHGNTKVEQSKESHAYRHDKDRDKDVPVTGTKTEKDANGNRTSRTEAAGYDSKGNPTRITEREYDPNTGKETKETETTVKYDYERNQAHVTQKTKEKGKWGPPKTFDKPLKPVSVPDPAKPKAIKIVPVLPQFPGWKESLSVPVAIRAPVLTKPGLPGLPSDVRPKVAAPTPDKPGYVVTPTPSVKPAAPGVTAPTAPPKVTPPPTPTVTAPPKPAEVPLTAPPTVTAPPKPPTPPPTAPPTRAVVQPTPQVTPMVAPIPPPTPPPVPKAPAPKVTPAPAPKPPPAPAPKPKVPGEML